MCVCVCVCDLSAVCSLCVYYLFCVLRFDFQIKTVKSRSIGILIRVLTIRFFKGCKADITCRVRVILGREDLIDVTRLIRLWSY